MRRKTKTDLLSRALEALQWCGGSSDFSPGGKARKGWLLLCQPVLEDAGLVLPRKKRNAAQMETPEN